MDNNERNLKDTLEQIGSIGARFSAISEGMGTMLYKFLEPITKFPFTEVLAGVSESLSNIAQAFKELPAETKEAQYELLKRGWYLAGDIAISDVRTIKYMSDDQIEEMMLGYARELTQPTLERINGYFPLRYDILKDAFTAHENRLYNLSIPVMLSQSDGIAKDLLNVSMFKKKGMEPRTKKARQELIQKEYDEDSIIYSLFLRPLDIISSLQVDTSDRDEYMKDDSSYGKLNRHGVLHGIDHDYGSEANSLRCIMLLCYLMDLKEHFFIEEENI